MSTINATETKFSDRISSAVEHAMAAVDQTMDAVEHTRTTVGQAKNKVGEFGDLAVDKFDEKRGSAASGLEEAASTLHHRADHLPGGPRITDMAHAAADKLDSTAAYVRRNDFNSMVSDAGGVVKKNPGPSLLIAAGLGFALGRAFSHDRR